MSANRLLPGMKLIVPRPATRPWARIVAVSRVFWPDPAPTGQALGDLAWFLAAQGWSVRVLASRLRHDDPEERLPAREVAHGVRIRRVWSPGLGRGWRPGRALDALTFYLAASAALLAETRRGDLILVTSDPPLFAIPAALVAWLRGARLVTWNHTVFPEVAGALGRAWAEGRLGRLLARLRNWAFGRAVVNVAASPEMGERLKQAGVTTAGMKVVETQSDAGIHPVPPADNPRRADWGLSEAFVIGYSGYLGRAHMPERVAELVRRTHDLPGLAWVFIGGGSGLTQIRDVVAEAGAKNVHFHPWQHRDDLALSLSVPDLHLVALEPACEGLIAPGNTPGILAAGRPVLYFGDPASGPARDLERRGLGVCLDPAAPEAWRATIAALKRNPGRLQAMGARALARSADNTPAQVLLTWRAVLTEAALVPRVELG